MTVSRQPARATSPMLIGVIGICLAGSSLLVAQAEDVIAPSRVAVIDVQRLVLESETGKRVLERLRDLRQQKMAEVEVIQQEIRELQDRVQASGMSLSEDEIAQMEKQIEDRMIDLQRFNDDTDRILQTEQEEAFAQIEREVMPIINQIGEQEGYALIFNKYDSGLLFAVDRVDITDMILQRYNAAGGREDG